MSTTERDPNPGGSEFRYRLLQESQVMTMLKDDLRFSEIYYSDFSIENFDTVQQEELDRQSSQSIEKYHQRYKEERQTQEPFIRLLDERTVALNAFDEFGRLIRQKLISVNPDEKFSLVCEFYYWQNDDGVEYCLEMHSDEEKKIRYNSELLYVEYDSIDMVNSKERKEKATLVYSVEDGEQVVRQYEKSQSETGWNYVFERGYQCSLGNYDFELDYENLSGSFGDKDKEIISNVYRHQSNPNGLQAFVETITAEGIKSQYQKLSFKNLDVSDIFRFLPTPELFDTSLYQDLLDFDLKVSVARKLNRNFKHGHIVLKNKAYQAFELNNESSTLVGKWGRQYLLENTSILAAPTSESDVALVGIDAYGHMQLQYGNQQDLLPAGIRPQFQKLKPLHIELLNLFKIELAKGKKYTGHFVETNHGDPKKAGIILLKYWEQGEMIIKQFTIGANFLSILKKHSTLEFSYPKYEDLLVENKVVTGYIAGQNSHRSKN